MDEPELDAAEQWFLAAFDDLTSERPVGFGVGEIPWSAKVEYASYHGLDKECTDLLIFVTKTLDQAYLKWNNDEVSKAKKG